MKILKKTIILISVFACLPSFANEQYRWMNNSISPLLHELVFPLAPQPIIQMQNKEDARKWMKEMDKRMVKLLDHHSNLHDEKNRHNLLSEIHYEATRGGLDPQLILSVIHVESAFRKYAISKSGAMGLMQIMPFWADVIGDGNVRKMFDSKINIRYGVVILRHYLDMEKGDMTKALARYNGSYGKKKYPNKVYDKLNNYWYWDKN